MNRRKRFEFIAGSPALCFVDTLGNRTGAGKEWLVDPQSLDNWLTEAKLSGSSSGQVTDRDLKDAQALREAIYRCGLRAMQGESYAQPDLELLNRAAAEPPLRPQLKDGELVLLNHGPKRASVKAALSVLAADALQLFTSALRQRIRRCPECGMMFVDTSRPGKRRWCSSAKGCGNRAKVRNWRTRRVTRNRR
jgi:predicted RNA-binding Zn ribbon-like protein